MSASNDGIPLQFALANSWSPGFLSNLAATLRLCGKIAGLVAAYGRAGLIRVYLWLKMKQQGGSVQLKAEERVRLSCDGFVLLHGVLDAAEIERLGRVVAEIRNRHEHHGRTYAARNLLGVRAIADLARSDAVAELVREAIETMGRDRKGPARQAGPMAVRGLLFNKVAEANWAVPWHQDLTIAVRERREAPGFGPWSVKDGVVHVQPPDEVIARMLAVRIHLDDTDAENGALRVIPGSHREGRLSPEAIGRWTTSREAATIEARAGSALLMRPHLLHASSVAERPAQRRVIHLEYSADELPFGLEWVG